jgi:hypothetical protein
VEPQIRGPDKRIETGSLGTPGSRHASASGPYDVNGTPAPWPGGCISNAFSTRPRSRPDQTLFRALLPGSVVARRSLLTNERLLPADDCKVPSQFPAGTTGDTPRLVYLNTAPVGATTAPAQATEIFGRSWE